MPAKQKIVYPYLPKNKTIKYVDLQNQYMRIARSYAYTDSRTIEKDVPTSSVMVKDNKIIGVGASGSDYHRLHGCERIRLGIPTGQQYELCEGCHPKNHSESRAIKDALEKGNSTKGADLYLWGHWWCCEPCWNAIIKAGIKNVFLLKNSEILFDRTKPENIIGRQFADYKSFGK